MKRLLMGLAISSLATMTTSASGAYNYNGTWMLHYAGTHDPVANTCSFQVVDCMDLEIDAPSGPGRYDIYVLATDVTAIAATTFGLSCSGTFQFYGWTGCAESQNATPGWPGCNEGITLTWSSEQPGPHVTLGILDVYVYGPSSFCASTDPRVGYGEFCDGTVPEPLCNQRANVMYFSCMGFGTPGYRTCPFPLQIDQSTWGAVKALYK